MSRTVHISHSAETDLRGIFEYIAYEIGNELSARRILQGLMSAIEELAENPERWYPYPREPWHSRGVRTRIVGSYVAFFAFDQATDELSVGRVLYCRRDFDVCLADLR